MSKTQKFICIVLGIVLVGLVFSMTKPYRNIKDSLFSKSDTLTTYMETGVKPLNVYDSTYCRTADGVLVVILCKHVLASDIQKSVVGEVGTYKFAELSKCLSPKNKWYITNILVNKNAMEFFTSVNSLAVNSKEILVVGKIND